MNNNLINNMKNYYEILNIEINATEDEIYQAYNIKIAQFNHLPFHTQKMIAEIKLLKEALYVLSDNNKRKKYNSKYEKNAQYEETDKNIDNTKICDRLFSITF
jgi:DnaJ-class molecular chaperone